ncbi:TPA: hypothetical protein ACQPGJ_001463, partial [Streptococcus pyogenes]
TCKHNKVKINPDIYSSRVILAAFYFNALRLWIPRTVMTSALFGTFIVVRNEETIILLAIATL